MCLITDQKEPFIAEEGIVVYKAMREIEDNFAYSLLQGFAYKMNSTHFTTILPSYEPRYASGYDRKTLYKAYSEKELNKLMYSYEYGKSSILKAFGQGFHSFVDLVAVFNHVNYRKAIVKCIIPKGAEYYLNASGVCVSNQIIIKEKI